MTRSRYRFGDFGDAGSPHFMTCTICGWMPVFTRPETVQIVLDSWRFLQDKGNFKLFGYVILENHLHLIASSPELSDDIRQFKSFTARRIIDHLHSCGAHTLLRMLSILKADWKTASAHQLWEEGSHPQIIAGDEMMVQKLEYVHMNPVKRGYVDDPTHWRYSSPGTTRGWKA